MSTFTSNQSLPQLPKNMSRLPSPNNTPFESDLAGEFGDKIPDLYLSSDSAAQASSSPDADTPPEVGLRDPLPSTPVLEIVTPGLKSFAGSPRPSLPRFSSSVRSIISAAGAGAEVFENEDGDNGYEAEGEGAAPIHFSEAKGKEPSGGPLNLHRVLMSVSQANVYENARAESGRTRAGSGDGTSNLIRPHLAPRARLPSLKHVLPISPSAKRSPTPSRTSSLSRPRRPNNIDIPSLPTYAPRRMTIIGLGLGLESPSPPIRSPEHIPYMSPERRFTPSPPSIRCVSAPQKYKPPSPPPKVRLLPSKPFPVPVHSLPGLTPIPAMTPSPLDLGPPIPTLSPYDDLHPSHPSVQALRRRKASLVLHRSPVPVPPSLMQSPLLRSPQVHATGGGTDLLSAFQDVSSPGLTQTPRALALIYAAQAGTEESQNAFSRVSPVNEATTPSPEVGIGLYNESKLGYNPYFASATFWEDAKK